MRIPSATYRLQVNRDFPLAEPAQIIDYLRALGISDCYVSPITHARAGSGHGYDVISHSLLNPEIGGEEGFRYFVNRAHEAGIYVIVDTVPNHMCIADAGNRWWFEAFGERAQLSFCTLLRYRLESSQGGPKQQSVDSDAR